jgi:hypothetical protein
MALETFTFENTKSQFKNLRYPYCRSRKDFLVLPEQGPEIAECWACKKTFKIWSRLEVRQVVTIEFGPQPTAPTFDNPASQ